MRQGTLRTCAWTLVALGTVFGAAACGSGSDDPNNLGDGTGTDGTGNGGTGGTGGTATTAPTTPPTPEQQVQQILDERKTDYGEALRTASLKLRDQLPSLDEINKIANAPDDASKKVAYETLIDTMISSDAFSTVMIKFWRDTFKTGGAGANGGPSFDTAAVFAAEVTVNARPYTDILTATSNTCPTAATDQTTGKVTFTDASCTVANGGPTSGVLSDPGILAQYFANMAFRRTRFIQETFVCSKFPAEVVTGKPMGNGTYTSPWDFNSIVGKQDKPDAKIDFQDTSSVICANCHTTLNHIAPLFLNYDDKGALQTAPQVEVPIPGTPKASINDYLPTGQQQLAWRNGKTITDIPSLGQAMAADPDVAKCAVNRAWNYAMSRGDIVNDLATVPDVVTQPYVDSFKSGGMKFKETLRAIFKSEDFTKF